MPEFSVEFSRTTVHTCSISVTAADEEKATEKAEQMIEQADLDEKGPLMKAEWNEENTNYEVNSVDEE